MVNLSPMPAFPTSFSNTATITNYGINVGVIFGGFIIAAIILSIVMIVMCCCYCCRKPKEGSQSWLKFVHLGISGAIVAIAIVGCAVGWSYNSQCDKGVKHMSDSVVVLLNGSSNLIGNIDNFITDFTSDLAIQVNDTVDQISNFTGVLEPMDMVVEQVAQIRNNTQGFAELTDEMITNTTIIRSDFQFMANSSSNLTSVPAGSEVPDIDPSFLSTVQNANNSASDLYDNIKSTRDTVNNTLNDVVTSKLGDISDQTNKVQGQVSSLTSNFDDIRGQLNSINKQYSGTYQKQVNNYSSIRTSVVTAILVLPIVITILMAVGVFFRNTIVLKVAATLSFIFFFWYMLIAGVNYTLYTVTHGFCLVQNDLIQSALGGKNTTVGNHTFPISEKVNELLECSGDTSLLTIFEADSFINDLLNTISSQTGNINQQIAGLNFTQKFSSAHNDTANFKTKLQGLDFSQAKNITSVQGKLDANIVQLNNITVTAQGQLNITLVNVNEITQNAQYPNGTAVPSTTYVQANISLLNCDDGTWHDITQHDALCRNQTIAQTFASKIAAAENTLYYAEDASDKVGYLSSDLVQINNTQVAIIGNIDGVDKYLDAVETGINSFTGMISGAIVSLVNFVITQVGQLKEVTGCSFVGNAYGEFTTGFCKEFSSSLQVIGAMMVLGAGALFLTAVHSVIAIYKIRGSDDDDFDSSHSSYNVDDEEKGKKNVSLQVRSSQD